MKKIIIIGGGIAGLSAAFILSHIPDFEIEIYEKENEIGGQASSQMGKYCYVEYSWRIFGQSYHNINYIIDKIGVNDNFTPLKLPCIIDGDKVLNGTLDGLNLMTQIIKSGDFDSVSKLIGLSMICKDRAIREYDNVNAYDYFNKNPILQTILGPFLGLDANKVSLSSFMKNVYSTTTTKQYKFSPTDTRISKYPTQESLFIPWRDYLINRGVKIFTNSQITNINIHESKISSVIINDEIKNADTYIMALSLPDLLRVSTQISSLPTIIKLHKLTPNLQLYFTFNIYFSEELGR